MSDQEYSAAPRVWTWWWRAHHGLPYDTKLTVIAKRCGVRRGDVAAVWVAMLDYASQQPDRGSVAGVDAEEIAVNFDYAVEDVERIIAAFGERRMIANGRITAWERRQVLREREDSSAERTRKYRRRLQEETNVTPCDASVTPCDANETPRDAPEQSRAEHRREEQTTDAPSVCVGVLSEPQRKTEESSTGLEEQFESVWNRWPRRVGKDQAARDWVNYVDDSNLPKVLACVERYLASDEVKRGVCMRLGRFLVQCHRDDWENDWPLDKTKLTKLRWEDI